MRMAKNVNCCKECPNYSYYSVGTHQCNLVNEEVTNEYKVATFCPLPIYPSGEIASLENSLRYYQSEELKKYMGFSQILMQHIAAGFKTSITGFASVEIKVKEDGKEKTIFLRHDHIRDVDATSSSLTFFYGGDVYKVARGRDNWTVQKAVTLNGGEFWHYVTP